ncbi:MAG: hypothetical protein AB7O65_02035 [Candidatus Korobacteraceae bacterium]
MPLAETTGNTAALPQARATVVDRILACLAYMAPVFALALLLIPRLRQSLLVRFHVIQSVLFYLAVLFAGAMVAGTALWVLSGMMLLLVWPIYGFGVFVVWLLLIVKAGKAEVFQLPLVGSAALRASGL